MPPKLVIVTNGNYFARLILNDLFTANPDWISGIMIVTGDYKARSSARAFWEVGKVTTKPYLVYKVLTNLVLSTAQVMWPDAALSVRQWTRSENVPILEVQSVNSSIALTWVASIAPDLLISVSCPQMIRKAMLAIPDGGGINIHSSLLPAYAGLAPYYWVLSEGERITGTSVHYMTLKFDEGNVLAQERLEIMPSESALHLFRRLAIIGSPTLLDGVNKALDREPGSTQSRSDYSYFSHPTWISYKSLRRNGHVLVRPTELIGIVNEERRRSKAFPPSWSKHPAP